MAEKKPLCVYAGGLKELQTGDTLPGGLEPDIIYATAAYNSWTWVPWTKPSGISFVYIWAIAGGGGGGGGLSGASGASRGGGSGGGSSALLRALFPASFLPETLYLHVGVGGAASGGNDAGHPGEQTIVSVVEDVANVPDHWLVKTKAGGQGSKGTTGTVAGGAAGVVGTLNSDSYLGNWALVWTPTVGMVGATGGNGANGSGGNITIGVPFIVTAGAGGGGCNTDTGAYNGGKITAGSFLLADILGGTGHSASPTCNGLPGAISTTPFFQVGASGGGCNGDGTVNGGVGGSGGDATGYGCGGGGGGDGITGGPGGAGGPGIVMIWTW